MKIPQNFWICYFTLRNSEENKLSLLEILQNGVTPLRNFKAENQDPWELHNFFLYTHGNSTSFLIDTLNFHMFNTPGNSMSSSPTPVWIFCEMSSDQETYPKAVNSFCWYKNLKLENCRSDINKTCLDHLHTLHLLKAVGFNQSAAEGTSKKIGNKKYR